MNQTFPPVNNSIDFDSTFDDTYHIKKTPEQVRASFTGISVDYTSSTDPVVVIFPSGNYNEPKELGRYKNLSVAIKIASTFKLPEYKVFSLETGDEIRLH